MHSARPSLPPRGLVGLLAGLTLVPLALLAWLGWRVFEQDRVLAAQQLGQQIESAADVVAATLQRALAADARRLADGERNWPDGAAAVWFDGETPQAFPAGRLAYLPVVAALREAGPGTYSRGQDLEFRARDHAAAVAAYAAQATSRDTAIRAGALLGLGRNLAALGRTEQALDAYARLSAIDDAAVAGVPAGVVGRYARARLFERTDRLADLRGEARLLADGLRSGRWLLSEPVYRMYAADLRRWSGSAPDAAELDREALADAAGELWQKRASIGSSGSALLSIDGQSVTAVWTTSAGSLRMLFATRTYVASHWLEPARSVATARGATVGDLRETAGTPGTGPRRPATPATVTRRPGETGLPWEFTVAGTESAAFREAFLQRRRLLLAGFALLAGLSLLAGVLILRAVSRELAVARLKSDFVAAVSHEFRTPLTSLRQFTDMLREHPDLGDDRRRVCYDAQTRATERLTRLVESLLDFGRIEAGARHYQFERRDGAALVRQVVDEFRRDSETGGHAIECRTDGDGSIDADGEALSRALWNLLDNAVKYSPGSGSVRVRTARRGREFAVAVEDEGIGIPPQERAAILTKFYRGERARTLGIKGTGIGLAMARQIVAAHHGRLEIESEPGRGSTFTIVLPVKE